MVTKGAVRLTVQSLLLAGHLQSRVMEERERERERAVAVDRWVVLVTDCQSHCRPRVVHSTDVGLGKYVYGNIVN